MFVKKFRENRINVYNCLNISKAKTVKNKKNCLWASPLKSGARKAMGLKHKATAARLQDILPGAFWCLGSFYYCPAKKGVETFKIFKKLS